MRLTLSLLLASAAGLIGPAAATAAAPSLGAAPKPNVVLLVVDDLNTDVGFLGAPVPTPNMDRLAAAGMSFTDAHCNSPVCNPSRTSFLLGRLASRTGITENQTHFRDVPELADAVTLPQRFKESGYEAVGAGKIFHNGWKPDRNPGSVYRDEERSWTAYAAIRSGTPDAPEADRPWHRGRVQGYWRDAFRWGPIEEPAEETGDWRNAGFLAERLAEPADGTPRFLACGIFRPHLPFYAPQAFFDAQEPVDPDTLPGFRAGDADDLPATGKAWADKTGVDGAMRSTGLGGEAVRAYRASTAFADACLGRVIDAWEASPGRAHTYVVLVSDHGFQLGEKGAWTKFAFWERVSRIPMVIAGPGIQPGSVCAAPVSLIDLYPTLVALAGIDPPAGQPLDGHDLSPLLADPDAAWPHPVRMSHQADGNHALIDDAYRYLRYADGGEELYDRAADPHDFDNLAEDPAYEEVLAERRAALNAGLTPLP